MNPKSTILVTGGAGFIGSGYVRKTLQDHPDWVIRVLDALTYAGNRANLEGIEDQITFIHGDIADPEVVDDAVAGCDAVLNFAAESHVDRSLMDRRPFERTNVEGTQVLLDAAIQHGVDRFLQVSTDEVYGDLGGTDHYSIETDPLLPRSPYAASKAAAEELVQTAHASHGLHTVLTRGSNTYGPRQFPEKIIPLFVTNAIDDRSLPIYGRGTAVRDYLHVEDHCGGIDLILHHGEPGGIYNLGARLEISACDIAEAILEALDKPHALMSFVADRPNHDQRYAVNPTAAESLGWSRAWSLEDGLQDTVAWYAANECWWRPIRSSQAFKDFEHAWYNRDR